MNSSKNSNTKRSKSLGLGGGINLLSWNINDVTDKILGLKTRTQEFIMQLDGQQIFCLQETKAEVKIPDYVCRNQLRPDSRSGGLCIGVHRNIAHLVESVDTSKFPDIMAVRIAKEATDQSKDLILVNIYDSPEASSYKAKKRKQGDIRVTLDDLSCFLSSFACGTPYLIVGDMNARTGNLAEPPRMDGHTLDNLIDGSFLHDSYPMTSTRNSEDVTVNERGKTLLDLTAEADLKIFNGSTLGDIFGRFTCMRYNGSSVVDYMMVSKSLAASIHHFKVLNFTDISDHRPITCRLTNCCQDLKTCQPNIKLSEQPTKYLWNAMNSPTAFLLSQNEPTFIEHCQNISSQASNTKKDVKEMSNKLVELLTSVARSSLEVKKPPRKGIGRRKSRKNPWFNADCIKSRIELRRACKEYCKSPTNTEIRSRYYVKRKEHKKLITSRKRAYILQLNKDIEEKGNIQWEHLKKLKGQNSERNEDMDLYDLANFFKFFKDLYSENTIDSGTTDLLKNETAAMQLETIEEEEDEILNSEISAEELNKNIKNLKEAKQPPRME